MTHPIDPLTPEHLLARDLWDNCTRGDVLSFLSVWEGMMVGRLGRGLHRDCHNEQELGDSYSQGFGDGRREAGDEAWNDGYNEAWREAQEKIGIITGERITQPSTE